MIDDHVQRFHLVDFFQAERLGFLRRSLARARAQNAELEILREQQEHDLAEVQKLCDLKNDHNLPN